MGRPSGCQPYIKVHRKEKVHMKKILKNNSKYRKCLGSLLSAERYLEVCYIKNLQEAFNEYMLLRRAFCNGDLQEFLYLYWTTDIPSEELLYKSTSGSFDRFIVDRRPIWDVLHSLSKRIYFRTRLIDSCSYAENRLHSSSTDNRFLFVYWALTLQLVYWE